MERSLITPNFYYLPFLVIILGFLIRILLYYINPLDYWYDETILISVSTQGFFEILDTLKAEPHPIGLFLFLKLLPLNNIFITRVIITGTSCILTILALIYAYKTDLVKEYKLSVGLALFFASKTFYHITTYTKVEPLAFPFLLLSLFFLLNIFKSLQLSKKINKETLIFLTLSTTILLLTSYTAYFFSFCVSTTFVSLERRQKINYAVFS